jgi:hypothetical protein
MLPPRGHVNLPDTEFEIIGALCALKMNMCHSELPGPASGRDSVLPRAARAAPRPEAAEPAGGRGGAREARGLRAGARLRHPRARLHARGGHAVVPRARDPARRQVLLHRRRRVEPRLHLRRDGECRRRTLAEAHITLIAWTAASTSHYAIHSIHFLCLIMNYLYFYLFNL